MSDLNFAAKNILSECMAVKKDELLLVVSDVLVDKIGKIIFQEAEKMGIEAAYMEIIPRENHGVEPPLPVTEAMKASHVVVMPTTKSLSHTTARKEANSFGARVASMPGITEEMMMRTLTVSYKDIAGDCMEYARILSAGNEVEIVTGAGTNLRFSIKGRSGYADTGLFHEKGSFGNLPAGEAFVSPVEYTAEGVMVIDGSMAGIGVPDANIELTVEKGRVSHVKGRRSAEELKALLNKYGEYAGNIAELGIGLNPKALLSGHTLEDEKVKGTIHIGLGDSSNFGGCIKVPSHLDGIMLKPTLIIDGQVLIKDGVFN